MKISRPSISILFVTLLAFVATGFAFDPIGHAAKSSDQVVEKSLDIERYPDEPLELVDLKVGDQSVKNKIGVKRRRDREGLDEVKFHETDEWFKRVRIRLRNVSGRPIIGLRVYLYFEPPLTKTLFRVQLTNPRQLQSEPLEPGAEIDLVVEDKSWRQTEGILNQYGANANLAAVTLSMDIVAFSDGSQWYRGSLSTNSFLVLDRNSNGTIDNGEELFGDITPQPASSSPKGSSNREPFSLFSLKQSRRRKND